MVTLCLYADGGEMAVSIAAGGVLRAAVRRQSPTDGAAEAQAAVECIVHDACRVAQIDPKSVDRVVEIAPGDRQGHRRLPFGFPKALCAARRDTVRHRDALLMLAAVAAPDDAALVVFHVEATALARKTAGRITEVRDIEGVIHINEAATRLCQSLGSAGLNPFAELAAHARGPEPQGQVDLQEVIQLRGDGSFSLNESLLEGRVADANSRCQDALADPTTVHSSVQRSRTGLAQAFLRRLSDVIAEVGGMWRGETCTNCVSFGGSLLSTVEIASRVRERCGPATFAPILDDFGAALGGALVGHERPAPVRHLGLGQHFDEQEVKQILENCRLEYVYEPDWSRLHARVSRWISNGALIGWFQGAIDFNRRSLGGRSVLADPSNRFARENLNVYLLRRSIGSILPLSLAPSAEEASLVASPSSPFLLFDCPVKPEAQGKLAAALDGGGRGFVHTPEIAVAPELVGLLEAHYARTGVPGLLNVTLESVAGLPAETPRDAVRAAFGSAVDVLVIGRFMIGKDYWLMRQTFQ